MGMIKIGGATLAQQQRHMAAAQQQHRHDHHQHSSMADKPTAASVFALYANGGSDISEEDFGMVVRSLGRCATNEQLAAAGGGKKTLADVEKFVAGMPVTDTKAMVAQISSSFHAGIDGDNTGLVTEESESRAQRHDDDRRPPPPPPPLPPPAPHVC